MFTKFARSNGAGGSGALDCFAAAARAAPMRLGRAEAIRFAVEEFTAVRTLGARMQVGDERFDSDEICQLYESSDYPLRRDVSRETDREC